jgi:RimJ/RimL family protein N-acetyltransferase
VTLPPDGRSLAGRDIRLDLLVEADADELWPLLADPAAYDEGYVMHRRPVDAADGRTLVKERFLAGQGVLDGRGGGRTTYAVRLARDSDLGSAGTLVGTSALLEADVANESVHLGSTFYGRAWWGTVVNPATKLLLLAHCFEDLGYGRVKIQTDARNTRSQAAIARLGAVREGVLRRHTRREDGSFRDTVVFSILAEEWPAVRAGLEVRLSETGPSSRPS